MSELVLTNDYGAATPLVLTNDETGVRVQVSPATPALVLTLTPIVGVGASSVSGPDIYAFAANYG
jgi:hypothetical protein